jgi:tetratricopeptide (TPR) repeat protein
MNSGSLRLFAITCCCVLTSCSPYRYHYRPSAATVPQMTLAAAKRQLRDALINAPRLWADIGLLAHGIDIQKVVIDGSGFVMEGEDLHSHTQFRERHEFQDLKVRGIDDPSSQYVRLTEQRTVVFNNSHQMRSFMNALYFLQQHSGAKAAADFSEFKTKAEAWRVLANKPSLSDEVTRQRILAENALKEKNFEKALEHYQSGLAVEPLWPEGQYNAGILCGELHEYEEGVDHLRRYLELTPDAPDTKAVRDKIIIWEDKKP